MNNSEKESLAAFVIDLAIKNGAEQVAVNIGNESEVGIQFRDGEIEQLQESQQNSLSVSIYCQHKYSSHSTNNFNKSELNGFIEKAVSATKFLTPDKYRELPDPKYYPTNLDIDLNLFDPQYEQVKTEERIKLVKEIYEISRNESDKIISVAAGYGDTIYSSFKAHSNGFSGHTKGTMFSASAEVTVKDNDSRPEDWYSAQSRFKNKMPAFDLIGKKAAIGALKKIGQSKIKSGTYNMLVENRASMRLISMLISPMSASSIQQKSSYLDGQIGKQITSELLSITDNPFIKGALGSKIFDGEGIASKERSIINNGVLQQYYIDSYYGKKLNIEPNGGSSSNLVLSIGKQSINEMIVETKQGILVTGFNGGNSNSTTGDFSFGISGFLFENGQIVKPINEMNISGNAKKLWKSLIALGNDPYPYSKWQVPSLLFEGIAFSGL